MTGASADPMIGQTIRGVYFIQEKLGAGGMGQVYKALHLGIDAPVALKILHRSLLADPTVVQRFHQEARAVPRLRHPNIIRVTDAGQAEDGSLFIAMEFVAGRSLARVIAEELPLPEQRVVHIGAQILSALAEAHANQILHRDLKPANVMLESRHDEPDSVKVLDFGIAKVLQPAGGGQATVTQHGLVCGTPSYMSPEQWGTEELDVRSDLYSVGVTLYEMLTGTLPFEAHTPTELVRKHLTERVPPPSTRRAGRPLSADLEALVLRALSADREERPPSAEEMRTALLACVLRPAPLPSVRDPLPATTVALPRGSLRLAPEPGGIDSQRLPTADPGRMRTLHRPKEAQPGSARTPTLPRNDRAPSSPGRAPPGRSWKIFAIMAAAAGLAVLCAILVVIFEPRPPPALTLFPDAQSVVAGRGEVSVTAALSGSNAPISWSLKGPGRISSAGIAATYVPPPSVDTSASATITASAGALTASAIVTITPRSLRISPAAPSVASGGGPVTFTAALAGVDGQVRWSLDGPGAISATDGASIDYTPPAAHGSGSATVTATADDLTTSATISIVDQRLAITPSSRQLWVGGGDATFTAIVTGSDAPVRWRLSGPGRISAGGARTRYTPPPSLTGRERIATVTAMAGTLTASATVELAVPVLSVQAASRVAPVGGGAVVLTATASGPTVPIRWSLAGPGQLSPAAGRSVKYTPPASILGPDATATVTATSGDVTASTSITVVDRSKSEPASASATSDTKPQKASSASKTPTGREPEWGQGRYRPAP